MPNDPHRHKPSRFPGDCLDLPLGSVSSEYEANANGERLIWLALHTSGRFVSCIRATRRARRCGRNTRLAQRAAGKRSRRRIGARSQPVERAQANSARAQRGWQSRPEHRHLGARSSRREDSERYCQPQLAIGRTAGDVAEPGLDYLRKRHQRGVTLGDPPDFRAPPAFERRRVSRKAQQMRQSGVLSILWLLIFRSRL